LAAPAARTILLALLVIPAVNYMGTYSLLPHVSPSSGWWLAATSANSASLLAAFAVYALLAFRYVPDFSTPPRTERTPSRS